MSKFYVGIDVGGTTIKYGIFDGNKKLIGKHAVKTIITKKSPEKNLIKNILDSLEEYCKCNKHGMTKANIAGIGFDIPGPVVNNQVLRAVNINWNHKYDIVKETKRRFGNKVSVRVINDANAATIGEYSKTLKAKYKNVCLMTLGTALGTGVIINNKLIEGRTGIAGEICHIRVDYAKDAIKCNCGNTGCLETIVSGRGIANAYKRLYLKNKSKNDVIKIGEYKVKVSELEAMHVIRAAKKKDKKALKALNFSLDYMADAIAMIMHVYEPEVVLIGGGVSKEGPILTQIVNKCLKEKIFITKKLPKIMLAKLKNDAGIYGVVHNL